MQTRVSRFLFLFVGFAVATLTPAQSNKQTARINLSSEARASAGEASVPLAEKKKPDKPVASDTATISNTDKAAVNTDPLLRVLVNKGLLTADEARAIVNGGAPGEQRDRLAALLKDKGLISAEEFAALRAGASVAGSTSSNNTANAAAVSPEKANAGNTSASTVVQQPAAAPSVIAAVAPIRLLQVDPPKREGLIPDIKLGSGA